MQHVTCNMYGFQQRRRFAMVHLWWMDERRAIDLVFWPMVDLGKRKLLPSAEVSHLHRLPCSSWTQEVCASSCCASKSSKWQQGNVHLISRNPDLEARSPWNTWYVPWSKQTWIMVAWSFHHQGFLKMAQIKIWHKHNLVRGPKRTIGFCGNSQNSPVRPHSTCHSDSAASEAEILRRPWLSFVCRHPVSLSIKY